VAPDPAGPGGRDRRPLRRSDAPNFTVVEGMIAVAIIAAVVVALALIRRR
jgi:hypothetical protein